MRGDRQVDRRQRYNVLSVCVCGGGGGREGVKKRKGGEWEWGRWMYV